MNTAMYFSRKDNSPGDTVERIRGILASNEIHLFEAYWDSVTTSCHSVRVEVDGLPGVGTNGKGTTPMMALASAYAEFMERLQNQCLDLPLQEGYGLLPDSRLMAPDCQRTSREQVLRDHPHIVERIVGTPIAEAPLSPEVVSAPYYDVFGRKTEILPQELITGAVGSTGMCAGNTPEEALVQGLCEIMERHVTQQLFVGEGDRAPTIPRSFIESLNVYPMVEELERQGMNVIVKDLSLGGRLPVLGAIICAHDKGMYGCAIGSDPSFEIALQRCLTETFQGRPLIDQRIDLSRDEFARGPFQTVEQNKRLSHYWFTIDSETLPNRLLFSHGRPRFADVFSQADTDNRAALRFVVQRVRELGGQIYVRDVSFMGFPSYQVYVPELPDSFPMSHRDLALEDGLRRAEVKQTLLRLKRAPAERILAAATALEAYWDHRRSYLSDDALYQLMTLRLDAGTDLDTMKSSDLLLSLMFRRAGDNGRAYAHLAKYIEQSAAVLQNIGYYNCSLAYLRLADEGCTEEEISTNLESIFGQHLAGEVVDDLRWAEDTFKYFELPECGDCSGCQVAQACRHEQWLKLTAVLRHSMGANPIEQGRLEQLFV